MAIVTAESLNWEQSGEVMSRRVLLISLLLLALLTVSSRVLAFECDASPDPWFSFRFEIDQKSLPAGVEFISKNVFITGRYGYDYINFKLKNTGNTPFYIVAAQDNSKPVSSYPNSGLPLGIRPLHKLVKGKSYYYDNLAGSRPYTWRRNGGSGDDYDFSRELMFHRDLLKDLAIRVENVFQDDRPSSVKAPSPEEFSFIAYYGSKPIEVKGRIRYSLNEKYDPKSSINRKKSCDESLKAWENEQVEERALARKAYKLTQAQGVVMEWLKLNDPYVFNSCKVSIPDEFQRDDIIEGQYTIVSGMICGNLSRFWVDKQKKTVSCYIKYRCKEPGCFKEEDIGQKLCFDKAERTR